VLRLAEEAEELRLAAKDSTGPGNGWALSDREKDRADHPISLLLSSDSLLSPQDWNTVNDDCVRPALIACLFFFLCFCF
jgi:hypothetical protein